MCLIAYYDSEPEWQFVYDEVTDSCYYVTAEHEPSQVFSVNIAQLQE